jgi:perosamine synthetase
MEPYQRLEHEWAAFNGLDPARMVACSSGTAALHLALEAFRLPPGSEVLVPDYTMVACPRAVALAGLTPVFVDCDERLLMGLEGVKAAGAPPHSNIGAIMVVHVYGRRQDVGPLCAFKGACPELRVVEDLAEAHGVRPHGATDAACWSFQRTKHVHGEEGGAVWFRNSDHAKLARELRCLGFTDVHDYNHTPRGMNYRLANALADLVSKSLSEFGAESDRMRTAERILDEACPPEWRMPFRDGTWVYDFRVPGMSKTCQDEAVAAVKSIGIPTRHGFYPMHLQREFGNCRTVGGGNAEKASREVMYVPLRDSYAVAFGVVRKVVARHAANVG